MSDITSILWATISWTHHAVHGGMVPLSREVETLLPNCIQRIKGERQGHHFRALWRNRCRLLLGLPAKSPEWVSIQEKAPAYSDHSWLLEQNIAQAVRHKDPDVVVLEGVEEQLFLLADERKKWRRTRLVGISHQPPAYWRIHHTRPDIVKALDRLIVLSSTTKSFWTQYIDEERLVVIPHGVDADFFRPLSAEPKLSAHDGLLRTVFCGQWLRDFETLAEVVAIADELKLAVSFDLVVPRFARKIPACYQMAMSPRVRWHADLPDEELRRIYRQSDLLVLPLCDCTANNALQEGLACGLPVIVTDVGGVRDYANEQFADFVRPGDAAGFIERLKDCIAHKDKLVARGASARTFVEQQLSWKKVAARYAAMLRSLP